MGGASAAQPASALFAALRPANHMLGRPADVCSRLTVPPSGLFNDMGFRLTFEIQFANLKAPDSVWPLTFGHGLVWAAAGDGHHAYALRIHN